VLGLGLSVSAIGLISGCETKGFLDPTEVGVRTSKEPLVLPILKNIDPSIEENDKEWVNATNPTAADRAINHEDYHISPNDLLSVSISDLVAPGQQTIETKKVTEAGMISLPFVGAIRAEGLSEIELEQAITQAYKEAQLIQNANVSVTVVEARGRSFEIYGAVARSNVYAIPEADFRLMDALVLGGDVTSPLVDYIYVIRKIQPETPPASRPVIQRNNAGPTSLPAAPAPGDLAPRGQLIHPNDFTAPSASSGQGDHALNLLADAQANDSSSVQANTAMSASTPAPAATAADKPQKVIFAQSASSSSDANGFQFNSPMLPSNVRVIRIPYQALHNGDLNYNIAIHSHDVVWVKPLPVGLYYVYGHVARPGPFTLAGPKVTLKQAIGSAGMFDQLAIPQRAEIIRRIRPDHEVFVRINLAKIFSGEEPDLYIKPDDQINVGTNAIAPFLAALRGAFRITYGFGFLYDKNFAYNNFAGGL
jgi:polysaccharide export outer membrane protein